MPRWHKTHIRCHRIQEPFWWWVPQMDPCEPFKELRISQWALKTRPSTNCCIILIRKSSMRHLAYQYCTHLRLQKGLHPPINLRPKLMLDLNKIQKNANSLNFPIKIQPIIPSSNNSTRVPVLPRLTEGITKSESLRRQILQRYRTKQIIRWFSVPKIKIDLLMHLIPVEKIKCWAGWRLSNTKDHCIYPRTSSSDSNLTFYLTYIN